MVRIIFDWLTVSIFKHKNKIQDLTLTNKEAQIIGIIYFTAKGEIHENSWLKARRLTLNEMKGVKNARKNNH